jgi:hypothetical protein
MGLWSRTHPTAQEDHQMPRSQADQMIRDNTTHADAWTARQIADQALAEGRYGLAADYAQIHADTYGTTDDLGPALACLVDPPAPVYRPDPSDDCSQCGRHGTATHPGGACLPTVTYPPTAYRPTIRPIEAARDRAAIVNAARYGTDPSWYGR